MASELDGPGGNDVVWPWPGDSREDRDRRVARSYRTLCEQFIAGRVEDLTEGLYALDRQWMALPQANWAVPQLTMPHPDDQLTVAEVAYWSTRSEEAVRMWFSRARAGRDGVHPIETPEGLRVRWGDVIAYRQRQRQRKQPKETL